MRIRVLAAVIERNGRLLLCKRPSYKRYGGLWEFPGGKVEPGETDAQAIARELSEELGVEVRFVGPVEFSVADPNSNFVIEFLSVDIAGEPQRLDHSELAWISDLGATSLPLAPSDERYVAQRTSRTSVDRT
jgi:mutator protein MutT